MSEGHRLFNSLVDHERDICAAFCTSVLWCRSPPITGKVDATLLIFFLLSNRLTENDKNVLR